MNAFRKFRPHEVTATDCFEIEVTLTGTFSPGYPATGPSYASGGDPAEDASIEDVDVADIGLVVWTGKLGAKRFETVSLLDGVDRNSDAFRQIVENLRKLRSDDFHNALFAEVSE
jgi:hypothetical protein